MKKALLLLVALVIGSMVWGQNPSVVSFSVNDDVSFNMTKVDGNDEISSFYIGQCEVTEALWLAVMGGENPSSYTGNLEDNLPVERISWQDAKRFIITLSARLRIRFRFITEAEWRFAASGGNLSHGYIYSGSNILNDVAWNFNNCSHKMTVGTRTPNELGIYDMSGNVYEIIQNPSRIYGGGWHAPAEHCEVDYWWPAHETFTDDDTGLRIASTDVFRPIGDVDSNGKMDVADLTLLIDLILAGDVSLDDYPESDVNYDDNVTIEDVTDLIDMLVVR